MRTDMKTAWLTALRSGLYTQGQGTLVSTRGREDGSKVYCCLGVLCDVLRTQFADDWNRELNALGFTYDEEYVPDTCNLAAFYEDEHNKLTTTGNLPPELAERLGISDHFLNTAINKNDQAHDDFSKIAEWAESIDEATFDELPDEDI